jgi:hypothetical protein
VYAFDMIRFVPLGSILKWMVSWDHHNRAIGGAGPGEMLDIDSKAALQNEEHLFRRTGG